MTLLGICVAFESGFPGPLYPNTSVGEPAGSGEKPRPAPGHRPARPPETRPVVDPGTGGGHDGPVTRIPEMPEWAESMTTAFLERLSAERGVSENT